jgi:exopolyphosphatase / guanosine-5'-triphosphate,3'-diphosphate pyrophosphatase
VPTLILMVIRIIDIGSNSIKASLFNVGEGLHRLLDKDKLDYSLGEAVFSDGFIPEAGLEKVSSFVQRSLMETSLEKPRFTLVLGTSAVRSAKNRDTFVKKLEDKTGSQVRILSGAEESYLIHAGIVSQTGTEGVIKTIDIGGGSAEVSWSRDQHYLFGRSYELGAIRLMRRFLNGKPYTREAFQRIYDHAWEEFRSRSPAEAPAADRAIASSGNVRAIVKMVGEVRSDSFSRQVPAITPGALEDLIEVTVGRTPQELASLFDLNLDRARIVMPAVLVLLASLRYFGIHRLDFADVGLREGAAFFWSRHGHLNLPLKEED